MNPPIFACAFKRVFVVNSLQNFIWNSPEAQSVQDLYFRPSCKDTSLPDAPNLLRLKAGQSCQFDTYFNSFSVKPWQEKCTIDDLHLVLSGQGRVTISIVHRTIAGEVCLLDVPIDLVEGTEQQVPIDAWDKLCDGLIYLAVAAQSDAYLQAASFATKTKPTNDTKLGIVVTHFKRKAYVLPAIQRMSEHLLSNCDISDNLALVVVDNSRDISPEESGKAILIPNQNLGGSGGFTRGLLHLKDNDFTHCLFMDDDASCEMDSIYRTYRLLQYAKDSRLAVAGAMLFEENLYETHEVGAQMRSGVVSALGNGLDLRQPSDVLQEAYLDDTIDYGAWWHFAFKIEAVSALPFPFFVRGDDQLFSLANDFDIVHLNGVAVWAESFLTKDTPAAKYLSMRSTLLLCCWQKAPTYRTAERFFKSVRQNLFAYNYQDARALLMAAKDFLDGPKFWTENMDMSKVFPKLAEISAASQLKEIAAEDIAQADTVHLGSAKDKIRENVGRKTLRKFVLNGHLVPRIFLSSKATLLRGYFNTDPKHTFGHQTAIQIIKEPNLGFKLPMKKRVFLPLYLQSIYLSIKLALRMKGLGQTYANAMPKIMTEDFWRSVYKLDK